MLKTIEVSSSKDRWVQCTDMIVSNLFKAWFTKLWYCCTITIRSALGSAQCWFPLLQAIRSRWRWARNPNGVPESALRLNSLQRLDHFVRCRRPIEMVTLIPNVPIQTTNLDTVNSFWECIQIERTQVDSTLLAIPIKTLSWAFLWRFSKTRPWFRFGNMSRNEVPHVMKLQGTSVLSVLSAWAGCTGYHMMVTAVHVSHFSTPNSRRHALFGKSFWSKQNCYIRSCMAQCN